MARLQLQTHEVVYSVQRILLLQYYTYQMAARQYAHAHMSTLAREGGAGGTFMGTRRVKKKCSGREGAVIVTPR